VKKIGLVLVVGLLLALTGFGLQQQPPTGKQQQPSVEDQLAVVRLRAQILDAQTRIEKAQVMFREAQKDYDTLNPQLPKLIDTIKAKLPAPAVMTSTKVASSARSAASAAFVFVRSK